MSSAISRKTEEWTSCYCLCFSLASPSVKASTLVAKVTYNIAQEKKLFEDKWWWPKLTASRLNDPPEHSSLHANDYKHDFGKGIALPLPSSEVGEVTNPMLYSAQYEASLKA